MEHIKDFSEKLGYAVETVEADAFDDRSKLQSEVTLEAVKKWNPQLVVFDGPLVKTKN